MHKDKTTELRVIFIRSQAGPGPGRVFTTTPLPGTEGRVSPKRHQSSQTRSFTHKNQLCSEDLSKRTGHRQNLKRSFVDTKQKTTQLCNVCCDIMLRKLT